MTLAFCYETINHWNIREWTHCTYSHRVFHIYNSNSTFVSQKPYQNIYFLVRKNYGNRLTYSIIILFKWKFYTTCWIFSLFLFFPQMKEIWWSLEYVELYYYFFHIYFSLKGISSGEIKSRIAYKIIIKKEGFLFHPLTYLLFYTEP